MNIQLKLSKIQARIAELKRQECEIKTRNNKLIMQKIMDLIIKQKADVIKHDVLIKTIESAIINIKSER